MKLTSCLFSSLVSFFVSSLSISMFFLSHNQNFLVYCLDFTIRRRPKQKEKWYKENQQFCSIIANCFPDSIQTNRLNHKCICDPHFGRAALISATGIELQKWASRSLGAPSICCSDTPMAEPLPSFFIRLIKITRKTIIAKFFSQMPMYRAIVLQLQGSEKTTLNNALLLPHLFVNFYPQIRSIPKAEEALPRAAQSFKVAEQIKQRIMYNHHKIPTSILFHSCLCEKVKRQPRFKTEKNHSTRRGGFQKFLFKKQRIVKQPSVGKLQLKTN